MIEEEIDNVWKQHYPSYHFKERDIALEEYKVAAKTLEAEERVFLNASNITLVAAAALGSLAVGSSEKISNLLGNIIPIYVVFSLFIALTAIFSIVTLKYFADRQRSIVFAARKVIVLRRMLGLSYGHIQLVLPNWRIEGADQPFAVKLFSGWNTYVAYPFYILSLISSAVLFFLLAVLAKNYENIIIHILPTWVIIMTFILLWYLFLAYVYRMSLLDTHERPLCLFARDMANTLYLSIVENVEYVIYRAKLATYETSRQKIDLTNLKKVLVFIEDKEFFKHSGISFKAIARGFLGILRIKRKSGGSTITQQVARTLFIHDLHKTYRRKIVEILLALWLDKVLSKSEIIDIYLSSVRFEKGVFGVLEGMHWFFGKYVETPSLAQAFFLIERVSNIRSRLLSNKIIQTIKAAQEKGLMSETDIVELVEIYAQAIKNRKINVQSNEFEKIKDMLLIPNKSEKPIKNPQAAF